MRFLVCILLILISWGPFGAIDRERPCAGKLPCHIWCQFYFLETGVPGLKDPDPFTVFCDPLWDPAKRPLQWFD